MYVGIDFLNVFELCRLLVAGFEPCFMTAVPGPWLIHEAVAAMEVSRWVTSRGHLTIVNVRIHTV